VLDAQPHKGGASKEGSDAGGQGAENAAVKRVGEGGELGGVERAVWHGAGMVVRKNVLLALQDNKRLNKVGGVGVQWSNGPMVCSVMVWCPSAMVWSDFGGTAGHSGGPRIRQGC
jgi:hypothetical protein